MARSRSVNKEESPKKKPVVVEAQTLEKPSPPPPPPPRKPCTSAPLANAFDLLDEDSSDLIGIVDAKEEDTFVAAERKRIEEKKAAAREAKKKAKEEEKKAAREAKKKAKEDEEREQKAQQAWLLGFRTTRPSPPPRYYRVSADKDLSSQLGQHSSALELQAKESESQEAASFDGSSSKSSDGRRKNVNGSLRRKQKKEKKKAGEIPQQESQVAPVENSNNYPRYYTLKEYEEKKKREEDVKNEKVNAINNVGGISDRRRFENGGKRRFENGGKTRFDRQQVLVEEAKPDDASFSLEDVEFQFPVLAKQAPVVKSHAEKAVVEKAPDGKTVAGKAVAKKAGGKKP